jgi:hypothetical protein
VTGGVIAEFGEAKAAAREVMRFVREFAPRRSDDDYAVDVAFYTGPDMGESPPPVGVSPGPVGRTQRRFIVWHRLPIGLTTEAAVREWFHEHLGETERLVREYLPTRNKSYPAVELADEIRALRAAIQQHH